MNIQKDELLMTSNGILGNSAENRHDIKWNSRQQCRETYGIVWYRMGFWTLGYS